MTERRALIESAHAWFDAGHFEAALARRVAYETDSTTPAHAPQLLRYLEDDIVPALGAMGFASRIYEGDQAPPFLVASRIEDAALPTVLMYAHGDVVAGGDPSRWSGSRPFELALRNGAWYGRGTADNKGQHSINLAALELLIKANGRLGFNVRWLFEMGEERGSPGLKAFCAAHASELESDVFLASDGPRFRADDPTIFLGSRGAFNFELAITARDGDHHSGNWGGLLSNPATRMCNAIAALVGPRGEIRVPELASPPIPESVRRALAGLSPGEPGGPAVEAHWGDPSLTPAERVYGACALEVLGIGSGNAERAVNAIPGKARAQLQLRFVAGMDPETFVPALQKQLVACGFADVTVAPSRNATMDATRLDPAHPWARWVAASIEATTGRAPVVLPNLGGSIPNDCFMDTLKLPTVWVPHSYPGCQQHAPDEHLRVAVAREALGIMVGVFDDLGTDGSLALMRAAQATTHQ